MLAQVAAVTQGTGLSLRPYIFARMLHAVLAGALTFWFWNPAWAHTARAVPAMAPLTAGAPWWPWSVTLERSSLLLAGALAVLLACVAATGALRHARVHWWRLGRP